MAISHKLPDNQLPVLSSTDFSFGQQSTSVISDAYKFVIPVPALGESAEPLVYPSDHAQAGKPILDYKNRPIGGRGLVFFNEKDQAYQAVPADGTGVIIINEVQPAQAEKLDAKVRSLTNNPAALTCNQLKEILTYARTKLALVDVYNSTRSYVTEKLVPTLQEKTIEICYGSKKRNNEDIYQAIYVLGAFALKGVTATEQLFRNGGVVLNQQGELWGIQPEVFIATYRLANGNPINILEKDIVTINSMATNES